MQTTAINDPGICQSGTRAFCAKVAEWTDVLFELGTLGDPRNIMGSPSLMVRGLDAAFAQLF